MVADEELPPGLNQARGPATHSLPPDASGCRYRRVLCGAGGTILLTLTRSFAPTGPQGEISYRKVGGRAEGQTERAMSPAETLEEVRADCRARQRGRERRGAEGGCGLACEETSAFSSCLKSLEVFNDFYIYIYISQRPPMENSQLYRKRRLPRRPTPEPCESIGKSLVQD